MTDIAEDHTRTPPVFEDVADAAERIENVAVRTPLLRSHVLDAATGARVFLKPECLQRTGSFKIRGAYSCLSNLSEDERARGAVAFSSGNHAQGVAEAARLLGMSATIVMPSDAPAVKCAGVTSRGAHIRYYDRFTESREEIAREIAEETGAVLVPSYDHRDIIAGQGTVGLEIAEDMEALGEATDALICCVGGGGLIGGISLAFGELSAATTIYAAEPAGFDDHRRSVALGRRVRNAASGGSICDALLAEEPGAMTFEINKDSLEGGLVATDAEALAAVAFAFRRLKLVLEPGGAVALAALLAGRVDLRGQTVVVVLTGGNVDPPVLARALKL